MQEDKIILLYKNIKKIINIPKSFLELEQIFLKEYSEDKNKYFSFSYLSLINKEKDFSKIIELIKNNSNNMIIIDSENKLNKNKEIFNLDFLKRRRKADLKLEGILENKQKLNLLQKIKKLKIDINFEKQINENNIKIIQKLNDLINKQKEIIKNNSKVKDIQFPINIIKRIINENLSNTFIVFKSICDINYILYSNREGILSYDLNNNQIINTIKVFTLSYLKHFLDKINKRDLIISISNFKNNLKLWNFSNWECLLNMNYSIIHNIYSVCLLNKNNNIYIITSYHNYSSIPEAMKVFDLNGNKIKEIKDSNINTYFIDTYYDNIISKHYIISAHTGYIISYIYDTNTKYNIYDYRNDIKYTDEYFNIYGKFIINHKLEIGINRKELIVACVDGKIRIWDFNSANLIIKIQYNNKFNFNDICLWNNDYLLSGCTDGTFKLIDLKNKIIISRQFIDDNKEDVNIISLKKLIHPKYGECLISHDNLGQINLWISKKF